MLPRTAGKPVAEIMSFEPVTEAWLRALSGRELRGLAVDPAEDLRGDPLPRSAERVPPTGRLVRNTLFLSPE